jgi:hypothetical protein
MDHSMMAAVLAMRKWCELAAQNIDKVHKLCHDKEMECTNVSYLSYAAHEIDRISSDMEANVMQFLNVMKMLSVAGEALCEQLGEEFTNIIPPPPVRIEEVVHVQHQEAPPDKSHLN